MSANTFAVTTTSRPSPNLRPGQFHLGLFTYQRGGIKMKNVTLNITLCEGAFSLFPVAQLARALKRADWGS